MKCGELGHTNAAGQPCQQNIPHGARGCIWHSPDRTPAEKHFTAMKGGMAQKTKKLLPADPDIKPFRMTPFTSRQDVLGFVQDLARRVLTESIDARRVDVALRAASVALSAFSQEVQERMVEALLKLEHGGTAVIMLERLTESMATGRKRPLPGAHLPLPAPALGGDGS